MLQHFLDLIVQVFLNGSLILILALRIRGFILKRVLPTLIQMEKVALMDRASLPTIYILQFFLLLFLHIFLFEQNIGPLHPNIKLLVNLLSLTRVHFSNNFR